MKPLATFFACLLSMNAIIALSGLAAWFGTWWLSIAVAIVLALAVIVLGVFQKSGALWWAAFAGCFGGITGNQALYQILLLVSRPVVRDVRVEAIPAHPEASAFTLVDARVRDDLWGYYRTPPSRTRRSSSRGRDVYAAPLVDAGWTTEQPVAAWVICGEVSACRRNWKQPPRAAIRLDPGNQDLDACRAAADDAVERRGLKMAPDPVFLEWAESYEAFWAEQVDWYKLTIVIWNLVWFVPWLTWRIVALFRPRPPRTPASP